MRREGLTVALARELHGGDVAVGLFNRGDQPAEITANWVTTEARDFQVRDLWKHEAVSASGFSFTAMVPRHGVVLLRASARP